MDRYRVTFFGHRDFNGHQKTERRLSSILSKLLSDNQYVEFYIGRNGEFDLFVASVVKRIQKTFGNENNEMILVLPYNERHIEYYEKYYDDILIPHSIQKTHPKGAILKRNRWMAENCDLFICYVEKTEGGAYTALKYARKLGKKIINLAKEE